MPRTRSRPNTEAKFQDAVLELVAHEGCSALGVNAVSQKAGADKVLIYRYFGGLDGLLQRVAESRNWLPAPDDIVLSLSNHIHDCERCLRELFQLIVGHIKADTTTHQLVRWRKAQKNPLTNTFTQEWQQLWKTLPETLSRELEYAQREHWKHACALIALMVEAELCDEGLPHDCLVPVIDQLTPPLIKAQALTPNAASTDDDHLPTNLL